MKSLSFYRYAAIGLLMLNLLLVGGWWLAARRPGPADRPPYHGATLGLDTAQRTAFEELAKAHHRTIMDLQHQQQAVVRAHFDQLETTAAFVPAPAAAGELQRRKIDLTYRHFLEVKALLRPEQYAAFEAFRQSKLDKILAGADKRKQRPKD